MVPTRLPSGMNNSMEWCHASLDHVTQCSSRKRTVAGSPSSKTAVPSVVQCDPHGNPPSVDNLFSVDPYANRFLSTGREFLKEANLYNYRNRVYSPTLGRFLRTDPIRFSAGDINLYRYVSNNPVNLWDPDGLDAVPAPGGGYNFVVRPGLNLKNLAGSSITHPNDRFSGQCATGAQFLTGTNVNGRIHDAPSTRTWRPGEPVGKGMRPGTMVATGWENGRYPSRAASSYA